MSSSNSEPFPLKKWINTLASSTLHRPELDLRCHNDLGVTPDRVEQIEADSSGLPPPSNIRYDLIHVSNIICTVKLSITAEELWSTYQRNIEQERSNDTKKPCLTLIFVEDPNYGDEETDPKVHSMKPFRPHLNATAIWLHLKFDLPITFFQYLSPTLNYRISGNSCFTKNDRDGKPICLEGFYQNSHGLGAGPAHVFYRYSLEQQSTMYLVYNITKSARDLIALCARTHPSQLPRPLTVDVFLTDDLLQMWNSRVCILREKLITYETEVAISNFAMSQSTKVLQDLHVISQDLQIVRGNLLDLRDKVQFFHHIRQSYLNLTSTKFQTDPNAITSITESLALLGSRIDTTARWASNYYERASIRINLFFNLTTQADSHTNLSIARMTTKISVATQKDSSSMITIAAVTMFFLPGSFVSALFSMVFFNTQSNDSGQTSLSVAPQWWLFPTVTIPLTLAVFAVWVIWQRRRSRLAAMLPNVEFTEDDRLTEKLSSGSDTNLSAGFGINRGAFVHTPKATSQA